MLEKLKKICEKKLEMNKDNILIYERLKYINKSLNVDNIFDKISIEEAFSFLRDLGIDENDYYLVYKELVKNS